MIKWKICGIISLIKLISLVILIVILLRKVVNIIIKKWCCFIEKLSNFVVLFLSSNILEEWIVKLFKINLISIYG